MPELLTVAFCRKDWKRISSRLNRPSCPTDDSMGQGTEMNSTSPVLQYAVSVFDSPFSFVLTIPVKYEMVASSVFSAYSHGKCKQRRLYSVPFLRDGVSRTQKLSSLLLRPWDLLRSIKGYLYYAWSRSEKKLFMLHLLPGIMPFIFCFSNSFRFIIFQNLFKLEDVRREQWIHFFFFFFLLVILNDGLCFSST